MFISMDAKMTNVPIEKSLHQRAKSESKRTGMILYRLIGDAIEMYLRASPDQRDAIRRQRESKSAQRIAG